MQVRVDAAEAEGRRSFAIYSFPAASPAGLREEAWSRHATGLLGADAAEPPEQVARLAAEAWPPVGATAVEVEGVYDRLAAIGFAYGPSFQGIRSAWRRGEELFAELALDPEHADEAERYGLHPGLLDSALHGAVELMGEEGDGAPRMLFQWRGVRRYADQARTLRVRLGLINAEPWQVEVAAVDELGRAVLAVEEVTARRLDPEQLRTSAARLDEAVLGLDWIEVEAPSSAPSSAIAVLDVAGAEGLGDRHVDLDSLVAAVVAGAPPPEIVLAAVATAADDGEATRATLGAALGLLQQWLGEDSLAASRLVLVTRGAVAVSGDEEPDPGAAALWGMVRSAQSEHPGRFNLLDVDGSEESWRATPAALAAGEGQLALRAGSLRAPRLARLPRAGAGEVAFDPERTVLISGGASGLGALLARHLVREHGVRRLLLLGRRGIEAPGAAELVAELGEDGAAVEVLACDVADRDRLAAAIAAVPPQHPLGSVIHAAGLLDDGLVESLTPARIDAVARPKIDGALNLHALTAAMELEHFVVFSSFAATLGSPGQGSYSAANAFLDAFAQRRRRRGLVAQSLVWGPWSADGGMTRDLDPAEAARIRRLGAAPLSSEDGLDLFDAAVRRGDAVTMLARLDLGALRGRAREGTLPGVLAGLVAAPSRRSTASGESLARRLSGLAGPERADAILALVRGQVASVLGAGSEQAVDPRLAFTELGLDSLSAIELRNGLMRTTGLRLPPTLIFDQPTPAAVAALILGELGGGEAARPRIDEELERVERLVREIAGDEPARRDAEERLRDFNLRVQGVLAGDGGGAGVEAIATASDEELFALIDREGSP
jgi:NADP-dependent 3-hydroxy acid dehydrogenase YdfG/acyl carrier protein